MSEEQKSVQTVLTISNTDIVTMLMVKQKKVLEGRMPGLRIAISEIVDIYQKLTEEVLQKKIDENTSLGPLKEALETLHKVYNPRIPFRIDFELTASEFANSIVTNEFYKLRNHIQSDITEIEISCLPTLNIILGKEDSTEEEIEKYEDKFYYPNDEAAYEVPFKKKDIVKIPIAEEHITLIRGLQEQMNNIQMLLRDDTKLKDQIVAKMTEKAIDANTELQAIVGDILLLE